MSIATALGIASAAAPLIEKIAGWIAEGLSDDEIRKRLADPDHVGDDMLARIRARAKRGSDLLGRDPKPV